MLGQASCYKLLNQAGFRLPKVRYHGKGLQGDDSRIPHRVDACGLRSTHRESQEIRINTKNTDDFEVLLDNLSLMSIRLEQLEGLYNDAKLSSSLVPFSEVFSEGQESLSKQRSRTHYHSL